jgi:S-adenosylmethionine:tRNA ribosyltransferase-isomerase
MLIDDFDFSLPPEFIAQYPLAKRSDSRLLCLNQAGVVDHRVFSELPDLISPGDLLIFNNTRVIPARLLGRKITGGKVEVLVERILDTNRALVHLKTNKSIKIPTSLILENCVNAVVISKQDALFELKFDVSVKNILELLWQIGRIPLPKYMLRSPGFLDTERYQTVYATHDGAVAAPTAGLHFDHELLQALEQKGIASGFITLHVGVGTFKPVVVTEITEHKMHAEFVEVSETVCELVNTTRKQGGRIIAVGTTSARALETAASESDDRGELKPFLGDTCLFIYPGYRFRCIDALITNFHLPKSTLLILVCALGGYQPVMRAYQEAIAKGYRFYSYGDAMFLLPD